MLASYLSRTVDRLYKLPLPPTQIRSLGWLCCGLYNVGGGVDGVT